ncbi:MAG TPA: CHAT domain-containing tetratricopeptide repeat protein [Acidobacteriaceae bacterium]
MKDRPTRLPFRGLPDIQNWFGTDGHRGHVWLVCALALLVLTPLRDTGPISAQARYDQATQLFQRGHLEESQQMAEIGFSQFRTSDPSWADRFRLLEAESLLYRGMYPDTLDLLAPYQPGSSDPAGMILKGAIEAIALTKQQQFLRAHQRLVDPDALCRSAAYATCGEVLRAHGILAGQDGTLSESRQSFLETLAFAQTHHDRFLEAGASANLGWLAMQADHFDESVDWSNIAYRSATELGDENTAQKAVGNLGFAYLRLGDNERALEQFLKAEKSAQALGNVSSQLGWISTAGYAYRDSGDLPRARESYRRALNLAKQINSKEDVEHALEDLAQVSVDTGETGKASVYVDLVTPMELAGAHRLSANVQLTKGMLAAAHSQDSQTGPQQAREAESLFQAVYDDPDNPTTTRLGAGQQLARLYQSQGDAKAAEMMYKTVLKEFESARAQLKSDESKLPFVAKVSRINDDYIRLLVEQRRNDEALAVADRSRARTLMQGLGVAAGKTSFPRETLNPRQIAQQTGATLLFYWLGEEQSYLWAITPGKIALFPLPPQEDLTARIQRYRNAVLNLQDPLQRGNDDGRTLFQLLVTPALSLIRPDRPVIILADGALNQLNFEALLAPGPGPQAARNQDRRSDLHYWIDDATILSAPSLAMLASATPSPNRARSLLLVGNPISPSNDFPSLPLFGFEMKSILSHFDRDQAAVFTGKQATPEAYLSSNPAKYSYIHFVSHATSSRTDPLDSAIILSGNGTGADSFKLYARDIMRHPIDARLVTIAACSASGTRTYAGEGLVGLSWAFLRAGAHSVIGALWEVSDDSSPRLMNTLYQGIEDGQPPEVALRSAKLALLHSDTRFVLPYYWAPFQIYTRR